MSWPRLLSKKGRGEFRAEKKGDRGKQFSDDEEEIGFFFSLKIGSDT